MKGMAEQVGLNSRVLLQILPLARLIMRQKRRIAQPETTDHKDMFRGQMFRSLSPETGRKLRQTLEEINREIRTGCYE